MRLTRDRAEIYVPDGLAPEKALARTTHLGVCAHQDDLEIMSYDGILQCFQQKERWFTGIVVTNGAGSPRDDFYKDFTDEMMQEVRRKEQKKAAYVGEYAAVALLDFPSKAIKTPPGAGPRDDIAAILRAAGPEVVYTHNLADKHDTHVAVALRTVAAIRSLPEDLRPKRLYGVEVWRDLDWMVDADKVAFDLSAHENLGAALVAVFDSQICGGKRYDLATQGRRRAHATYHASHGTDESTSLCYGMDLTPLVTDPKLDPWTYVSGSSTASCPRSKDGWPSFRTRRSEPERRDPRAAGGSLAAPREADGHGLQDRGGAPGAEDPQRPPGRPRDLRQRRRLRQVPVGCVQPAARGHGRAVVVLLLQASPGLQGHPGRGHLAVR